MTSSIESDVAVIKEQISNHDKLLTSIADSIKRQTEIQNRLSIVDERQTAFHKVTTEKIDDIKKNQGRQWESINQNKRFLYKWSGVATALSVLATCLTIYSKL